MGLYRNSVIAGLLITSFLLAPADASARTRRSKSRHRRQAQAAAVAFPIPEAAPVTGLSAIELDRIEGSTIYFKAPAPVAPQLKPVAAQLAPGAAVGTPLTAPAAVPATALMIQAAPSADPAPIKTNVQDLKSLGVLRPGDGTAPYFFFSGRPLTQNAANPPGELQIYVFRPKVPTRITNFVYPGRILDPKTRAPLLESRAYIGRCLRRVSSDVFIVFQRERVDRKRRLQTSVFVAEPASDHLNERLLERQLPRINETFRLVRAKVCHEIDGRNRLMLSKPLDLTPRRGLEENENNENDDEEKSDVDAAQDRVSQSAASPVNTWDVP